MVGLQDRQAYYVQSPDRAKRFYWKERTSPRLLLSLLSLQGNRENRGGREQGGRICVRERSGVVIQTNISFRTWSQWPPAGNLYTPYLPLSWLLQFFRPPSLHSVHTHIPLSFSPCNSAALLLFPYPSLPPSLLLASCFPIIIFCSSSLSCLIWLCASYSLSLAVFLLSSLPDLVHSSHSSKALISWISPAPFPTPFLTDPNPIHTHTH